MRNVSQYSFDVNANAVIGTVIGRVQATDNDGEIQYRLIHGHLINSFEVNVSSGELYTIGNIDPALAPFETVIIASDLDGNSNRVNVTITSRKYVLVGLHSKEHNVLK